MGIRTLKTVLTLLFAICLLSISAPVPASEDIDAEEPIPSSVDEIKSPIGRLVEEKPVRPGLFPRLKEELKDMPPFFRDTTLVLRPRSFYRDISNYDGSASEAWAMGGAISYNSGFLYDHFGVGATLYTSQPLYAPEDLDGTLLLAPGQKGYTVLGEIYGRVKLFEGNFLNLYRYGGFNSPYLNKSDFVMTPYTFEGYTIQGILGGKDGAPQIAYCGGYITKIKPQNSEDFIWMSQKAGAEVKRGVAAFGALYSHEGFSLGAVDYYSNDIINIGYAEAGYTLDLASGFGVRFGAQFTDQRGVGANLLNGQSFSTNQEGVKTDISYHGGILSLAYTMNAEGADVRNPWSSYPGYTNSMINFYNAAGMKAVGAKISYDFTNIGLKGVAAYAFFTHGWGTVNPSKEPNANEIDTDVEWRPEWRPLSGLWLRLRYGVSCEYEEPKQCSRDLRVILNYNLPVL